MRWIAATAGRWWCGRTGTTQFAGAVEARGGAAGGDGGQLEVSGKGTLAFAGQADASAAAGQAGTLLLDPAFLTIGADRSEQHHRVLRTGTTANLQADVDIDVNAPDVRRRPREGRRAEPDGRRTTCTSTTTS